MLDNVKKVFLSSPTEDLCCIALDCFQKSINDKKVKNSKAQLILDYLKI